MNALLLTDTLRFVTNHPTPVPAPHEALVRTTLAGICGTDLELLRGYHGFQGVPGHEFVGIVEESPDAAWRGRRVVATINVGCGECTVCRTAGPEHCPRREVIGVLGRDGAFADRVAVPQANLRRVPDAVPDQAAVFVEPLAAALRVREQRLVRPSDGVAVLGAGRLGLLCAQVLALDGTAVTVVGRRPESLARAARLDLQASLADELEPGSFDVVVDATGSAEGLPMAMRLVRARGTVVLKSTYQGDSSGALTDAVVKEVRLVGSRCGPFEPALRLLAHGGIDVVSLIEASYPLREGPAAFEHAALPGALKVLLTPDPPDGGTG